MHSYAPVDLTPAEMHRLCEELKEEAFLKAHPIIQASFVHYALTVIHPFSDGNGRVARALASVFTYRAERIPMLVLAEDRHEYYDALSEADHENTQAFVDFTMDRCLNAVQLVEQSARAAAVPDLDSALLEFERIFVTKGGFTHEQVDEAGKALIQALHAVISTELKALPDKYGITGGINLMGNSYPIHNAGYRLYLGGTGVLMRILLSSSAPAKANVDRQLQIEVPKDCGKQDDLLIFDSQSGEVVLTARMDEILPKIRAALQMRLQIFAERYFKEHVHSLVGAAKKAYRNL